MALLESLDTTSVLATVLVLVAAYLYILNTCCRPVARKHPRGKKYKRVAREVEGTGTDSESPSIESLIEFKNELGAYTMVENFKQACEISADRNCFGYRPVDAEGNAGAYKWFTYRQIRERVVNFGSGVMNLNLAPHSRDPEAVMNNKIMRFMGFYSKNLMEWVIASQACNLHGVVVVPLYDTLGADAVEMIVAETGMTSIVCSGEELATVAEVAPRTPSLKNVVVMKTASPTRDAKWLDESMAKLEAAGLTVHAFAGVEEAGAEDPQDAPTVDPDDVATFCYTSGTTGKPKGAMLTHANIMGDLVAARATGVAMTQKDVHISYLPLAHMFERIVQESIFSGGGSIGFYQGDVKKILDDIKTLRPTIFPSVPRLYNRIYDKVISGAMAAGGLKTALFKRALAAKTAGLKQGYLEHPLWDALVFGKVAKRVGLDRCRLMVTGSAPIVPAVMEFLRVCFSCPVQEGYGQTECAAACTITYPDDFSLGHVGAPMPGFKIKLVDVKEMNYLSSDTSHNGKPCRGRGEICVKSDMVFAGYYKMAEKTAEAIDEDGWLHTGDIGLFTEEFHIRIIDRKKNIFKLSQGEYVAAEKIENVSLKSKWVAQAFVFGDSLHSSLVAVIVPDPDVVGPYASGKGLGTNMEDVCRNEDIRDMILADITAVCRADKLRSFEIPKAIFLEPTPWEAGGQLLTPTFKLKRKLAAEVYDDAINDMYARIGQKVAGSTSHRQGQ